MSVDERVAQLHRKSALFAALDHQMSQSGTSFAAWLRERRTGKNKLSYARLSLEIASQFGSQVNPSTIRLWVRHLEGEQTSYSDEEGAGAAKATG